MGNLRKCWRSRARERERERDRKRETDRERDRETERQREKRDIEFAMGSLESLSTRYNARNPSVKRILQEVKELQSDNCIDIAAEALEENIFEWHFAIRGAKGSDLMVASIMVESSYHQNILSNHQTSSCSHHQDGFKWVNGYVYPSLNIILNIGNRVGVLERHLWHL